MFSNFRSRARRPLSVLGAAAVAVGVMATATPVAAAPPGDSSLAVVSVTDQGSGLGAPVQDRPFDVVVEVRDAADNPTTVSKATTIVLEEVAGPGQLGGNRTAVIPRNGSGATISGATYSEYANGVELLVRVLRGEKLAADEFTVNVALTAVGTQAQPGRPLELSDPVCPAPTPAVPTCGYLLLPNGAGGHVTLSLGSCDGIVDCLSVGDTDALLVQALVNLKDEAGRPLYNRNDPATLVVACDKALCGQTGVPQHQLRVDLLDTGQFFLADPCPSEGVVAADQDACVDPVQSHRHQGDLYTYLLFVVDVRSANP